MVQIPMNVADDLPPHDERLQTVDADRLIGGVRMFHYTGLSSRLKVTSVFDVSLLQSYLL